MKRTYVMTAALPLLALAAAAQDDHSAVFEKHLIEAAQVKVMSLQGGVMGKPIKGAPYSAVEVNETTQMLADGTRIHNESQTQVFRDSEGRIRRETPNEITIWDPVANASYVLNPKTQTARKLPMGNFIFTTNGRSPAGGEVMTYSLRTGGPEGGKLPPLPDEARLRELKTTIEAEVKATAGARAGIAVAGPNVEVRQKVSTWQKGKTESIGNRMIEGVNAEGTRTTSTIESGAIGNDRAIQTVSERWFSQELGTLILSRHNDPRTGEETFKLVNVSRSEPAAYLFQIPAGYQVVDQK
jgi:hypothetical protein